MITARALGVYVYLQATGAHISAESLSSIFPEGRKAMLTALRELREAGLVVTSRQLVNGKFVTQSYLNGSPEKELLLQLNSYLILDTNSINKQIKSTEQVREDYTKVVDIKIGASIMDDDVFPDYDNLEEYRAKMMAKKKADYEAAKTKQREEKYVTRINRPKSAWSPSDSAFEFGYRVGQLWHIPEWRVGNSRFAFALAEFRKKYDTDGELECILMDMFFDTVKHEKSINDGEMLWKMFIKRAPGMVEQARASMFSTADLASQRAAQYESWEEF